MELEVLQVKNEGPIRSAADEPTDFIEECRAPITGQAHDFVLPVVYGKAEIGCKS